MLTPASFHIISYYRSELSGIEANTRKIPEEKFSGNLKQEAVE